MVDKISKFENALLLGRKVIDAKPAKKVTDAEINTKYVKGDIRIVTEQARYPLPAIKDMLTNPDYEIHPEFQRRHRWDRVKQSRLIESFIMNVPIPPIFLYEKDYSSYEVMDGLQRLTAIKEFYCDEFVLDGLEEWPELNGRRYSELPTQIQKGIDRRNISSIILLKETAKSEEEASYLKQMVFSRINSGGAKLEDQEFRNAQFQSRFNSMLQTAARNDVFCEIFDIPQITDDEDLEKDIVSLDLRENPMYQKMKDVETVLRFFAIRLSKNLWGNCPLRRYLDQYQALMVNAPADVVEEYLKLFESTVNLAYNIFGKYTFCIYKQNRTNDKYSWSKRPQLFVYDCIMSSLSRFCNDSRSLIEHKEQILEDTINLFKTDEAIINGRNTTKKNVEDRIEKFTEIFSKYYDK